MRFFGGLVESFPIWLKIDMVTPYNIGILHGFHILAVDDFRFCHPKNPHFAPSPPLSRCRCFLGKVQIKRGGSKIGRGENWRFGK